LVEDDLRRRIAAIVASLKTVEDELLPLAIDPGQLENRAIKYAGAAVSRRPVKIAGGIEDQAGVRNSTIVASGELVEDALLRG
jgi:hypothetical protein